MSKPKIIAYLKPSCGWSMGVRAVFKKYGLDFEDRDIINDPAQFQEMVDKTGQTKQPSVEIDGRMLADVSGEEIENWMIANNVVQRSTADAGAPINQPCASEMAPPFSFGNRR